MDRTALVHWLKKHGSVFGAAVMIIACMVALVYEKPEVFERPDHFVYDRFMEARATGKVHPAPIIIDIDEKSLRQHGQWPWPRYLLAELVRKLCDNGVAAVGLDILLTEPDRSSPALMQRELAQHFGAQLDISGLPPELRDNDAWFAETLARYPVVLGSLASPGVEFSRMPYAPAPTGLVSRLPPGSLTPEETLLAFPGLALPLRQFGEAAPIGLINIVPDRDGVFRRVPMLVRVGEHNVYAGLALRTLMVALGRKQLRIDGDKNGLASIEVTRKIHAKVGEDGTFLPVFHGPGFSFPYISAADILEDRVPAEQLAGRIAFVGTSAVGLRDIRSTPLDPNMPCVEVHATIVDNILTGQTVRPYPLFQMVSSGMIMAIGLLATFLFNYAPALAYVPVSCLMLAGATWVSWHYFGTGVFFSPVPLVVTLAVCAAVILSIRFWREERGRREIKQAFSRYVAPEVVSRIADRGGVPLDGEHKEVSVLFTDVRGFTSLSEKLAPEQVVRLLNRYFTPMTACVKQREGTLDKFVGDALMAFWNAPIDVRDHARKAVDAACAMQRELERLRPEFLREFGVEVRIGAGINTGPVHVGNMGSAELLDYTCIGDNVNLASRLEGLCKRYGADTVVSADTAQACGEAFRFRHLDRIRVKGKSQAVDIYTPLDEESFVAERETRWAEALGLYMKGAFAEAETAFATLLANHAGLATACNLYLERCRTLAADPPADWDGVWTYDSK